MVSFLIYSFPILVFLCLLFNPSSSTIDSKLPHPLENHHKHPHAWHKFEKLAHAKKGSQLEGIAELKKYFHRFGYYHHHHLPFKGGARNFSNEFDDHLECVVTRYQKSYGLPVTGTLNHRTLSMIMSPRCGMPDHYLKANKRHTALHGTQHFQFFTGQPRWDRPTPMTLTYAFSQDDMIQHLSLQDIRGAFHRAFSKWAAVIPVNFVETDDYGFADIKIGFLYGDHGDGEPFDGVLGVLAHAFAPENGKFHLDATETWTVDFDKEKSKVAIDLESVALHEIGHLLGMSHSNVKESVMYPSLKAREKKVKLRFDDIEGVQNLYGFNPNYTIGELLESETSSVPSIDLRLMSLRLASLSLILIICLCS